MWRLVNVIESKSEHANIPHNSTEKGIPTIFPSKTYNKPKESLTTLVPPTNYQRPPDTQERNQLKPLKDNKLTKLLEYLMQNSQYVTF